MQAQRRSHENEVEVLRGELQSVKEENNRQQQLLAQNLQLPPEARIEASLQHEITRLTNENLVSLNTFLTLLYTSGCQPTAGHSILFFPLNNSPVVECWPSAESSSQSKTFIFFISESDDSSRPYRIVVFSP